MRATPLLRIMRFARSADGHRRVRRAVITLIASVVILVAAPEPAMAHTGFESSTPSDGEVVSEPVGDVVISFTGPAIPAGDEFTALDSTGQIRTPSTTTTDGTTFVLAFDPPLAGGQIGVKWSVQAPDAHPIEGSFSFTVTAPTPAEPAPLPVDDEPSSTVSPAPAPAADDGLLTDGLSPSASSTGPTLDEFLATDTTQPGELVALIGRIVGFLAVVFVVGGIAFMATTLRGARAEIQAGLTVVRVLGLFVALGAALELIGQQRAGQLTFGAFFETPGLALLLRLIGGIVVAVGVAETATSEPRRRVHSLSAAVLEQPHQPTSAPEPEHLTRWRPASATTAWFGVAAILVSFWFDGHTVSKGPRLLHSALNSIHVAAGSVWAGGVVAMAAVVWWRFRRGRPTRAAELVVRFSSVATVALVAVGVAGMAMAVFVLDSFGELTGTEWGRILLLKTAFVAIAAGGGAYNHFRLLPALEAAPDDEDLATELRSTVTAEAIILAFVVVTTAWLVAAAS